MTVAHTQDADIQPASRRRWRDFATWFLLVVFCLGMVLSLVTVWARNQVLDTSIYVDTVAPLAADPDIQEAIADRVTALVASRLQLDAPEEGASTSQETLLRRLAIPATLDFVHRTTLDFVQSARFQEFWEDANTIAHRELLQILTSDDSTIQVQEDRLMLDLGPVVTSVEERLRASGLDVSERLAIDPATAVFVLVESPAIQQAKWAIRLIDTLALVLPIMTAAAFIGCLLVAHERWSMLRWSGVGMAIGGVVLIVGFTWLRSWYLNGLGADVNRHAMAAVFDIELRGLLFSARILTLVGLVIAGFATLANAGWTRHPAIAAFIATHRTGLLTGVFALACLALILVEHVSVGLVAGISIAGLASVATILWLSHQQAPLAAHGERAN